MIDQCLVVEPEQNFGDRFAETNDLYEILSKFSSTFKFLSQKNPIEKLSDCSQNLVCVILRDVEFAGSSTFSWKLDPADRLLDPAFSEKNNKYVENEFNQCQHYTAM